MKRIPYTASNIIQVDPQNPNPDIISKAARIIEEGGIVIIPTQGLYGIAADAFNDKATEKIFTIKNRPSTNPLLIFIKETGVLDSLVTDISPDAKKLMAAFWPGKVTLIFHAKPHLPRALTAGTGKIGIRIPGHPVTSALVEALVCPITGTSANPSGKKGCHDIFSLPDSILSNADLILNAGPLKGGSGSTVIDTTIHPVRILREGAVSSKAIFRSFV